MTRDDIWLLLGGQKSSLRYKFSGNRWPPRFARRKALESGLSADVPPAEDLTTVVDTYVPVTVRVYDPRSSRFDDERLTVGVLEHKDFPTALDEAARAVRVVEQLRLYFGSDYFNDILRRAEQQYPL